MTDTTTGTDPFAWPPHLAETCRKLFWAGYHGRTNQAVEILRRAWADGTTGPIYLGVDPAGTEVLPVAATKKLRGAEMKWAVFDEVGDGMASALITCGRNFGKTWVIKQRERKPAPGNRKDRRRARALKR